MKKLYGALSVLLGFFTACTNNLDTDSQQVKVIGERTEKETEIGKIVTDFFPASARQEVLWEERVDGLLSETAIKRIGEFLGTKFRPTLTSNGFPMTYEASLNSLRSGVSYNLRFWHQNVERSSFDAAYTDMHAWVADIPKASMSADLKRIVKYKIQHIWLFFEFEDGMRLVITKHHSSKLQGNQYVLLTNKVDGYSIEISKR